MKKTTLCLAAGAFLALFAFCCMLAWREQIPPERRTAEAEAEFAQFTAKLEDAVLKLPPNYCLGGRDPTKMTVKDRLAAFVAGPCLPIITVPGHQGTRLRVQIDCETFKNTQPGLFADCGWDTCEHGFFKRSPDKEYTLWVPRVFDSFSILSFSDRTSRCFGGLFSLVHNPKAEDPFEKFGEVPGLKVTWYGNTEQTKQDSNCGATAGEDLMSVPFEDRLCDACPAFRNMRQYLERLGYQSGLTFQNIPYDFRISVNNNKARHSLTNSIRHLSNITGKKVVIAAHSLGNLVSLQTLNEMAQEEKDKRIALFLSMAAPFTGAAKALECVLGGNPDYVVSFNFGLRIAGQRYLAQTNSVFADLIPSFNYFLFKDEPWAKELYARALLESKFDPATPEGAAFWSNYSNSSENRHLKFFPLPTERCFSGFKGRKDHCSLNMNDMLHETSAVIGDAMYDYSFKDILEVLEKHSMVTPAIRDFLTERNNSKLPWLPNPGVPTAVAFYSHLVTKTGLIYNQDPKLATEANKAYHPDGVTNTGGDDVVPTAGPLLAATKWAYEFETGVENAKPVKVLEFCSSYNQRGSFYDAEASPKSVNANEYIGVGCACQPEAGGSTSGEFCRHSTMIRDAGIMDYIGSILDANAFNPEFKDAAFVNLTEEDLLSIPQQCTHIF